MKRCLQTWCVLVTALASVAANYSTANFTVTAPTPQIAKQAAEYAERWRVEKAMQWLGHEMPAWGVKCPLKVTVTPGGAGGATTFAFDRGAILEQQMNVEGTLERILNSVLPHEVTHTVFAYHFRCPLPRWADEGGCVLSEDDTERRTHDRLVRQSLAGGRAFRLRVLFEMKDYPTNPQDIMTLYAEGYSITRFLVESSDRHTFLDFLGDGMRYGWDQALRSHFGLSRVEDLEEAWLVWMRKGMRCDNGTLVKHTRGGSSTTTVASTSTPQGNGSQAELGRPFIIRGASPDDAHAPRGYPTSSVTYPTNSPARPSIPPTYPSAPSPARDGWSPLGSPVTARQDAPAKLLPPQAD